MSYDPHGRRRHNADWADMGTVVPGAVTNRGFTGHEHLDSVGFIHMNGRVQDPVLGRFISVDPFIPDPNDLQSFNRYSYVGNNPLSFVDPSGFFATPTWGAIAKWTIGGAGAAGNANNSEGLAVSIHLTKSTPSVTSNSSGWWENFAAGLKTIFWNPYGGVGFLNAQAGMLGFSGQNGFNPYYLNGNSSVGHLTVQTNFAEDGRFSSNLLKFVNNLGSYIPGTQAAENAAQHLASVAVNRNFSPLARAGATLAGIALSLLTPDTVIQTTLTVFGGVGGGILKAGYFSKALNGATKGPLTRGRKAEARVLNDLGLQKNTQKVTTTEGRAIPDALTSTKSIEIKDAICVSCTKQIRIQTQAARQGGRKSVLITGSKTRVSSPARRAFDDIIRRDDLGPQ